jgi:type IV secretion system protein VirB4
VLIGFLVCMLTKAHTTQVLFDKDRGLEILVRALGGRYLPLKNGVPTGMNPLQLEPTPGNRRILKNLAAPAGRAAAIGRSRCARRATSIWRCTAR